MEAYDNENNSGPSNAERADFVSLYDEYQGLLKKDKPSFTRLMVCGFVYAGIGVVGLFVLVAYFGLLGQSSLGLFLPLSLPFIFAGIGWVVNKFFPRKFL